MICKHVDLIAVAILLCAIGLFSGAKHIAVTTIHGPVQYFRLDNRRQVRIPVMPRIPLQRD